VSDQRPTEAIDWRRVRRFSRFSLVLMAATITLAVFYQAVLMPLLVSAFLTYLLLPLVEALERRKLPRLVTTMLILSAFVATMTLLTVLLAPVLYRQATTLIQQIPEAVNTVLDIWLPSAERFVTDLGVAKAEDVHRWFEVGNLFERIQGQLQAGIVGLWRTGQSVIGGVVYVVLVPFITFFLLLDYHQLRAGVRGLIPRDLLMPADAVTARVNGTLRSVLKGQVTVAAILAVLYVIGLRLTGIEAAITIGIIAGICRLIPYFDVVVGGVLSAIVILSNFTGFGQVMGVAFVFLAVQTIDGAVITPRVIGERVGLHPLVVVVSVLAFADWMGFWGVLLAIPIVAIFKALISMATPYYFASRAYQPLTPTSKDREPTDDHSSQRLTSL
jgi:predicted PurR-regulated permease PerM